MLFCAVEATCESGGVGADVAMLKSFELRLLHNFKASRYIADAAFFIMIFSGRQSNCKDGKEVTVAAHWSLGERVAPASAAPEALQLLSIIICEKVHIVVKSF